MSTSLLYHAYGIRGYVYTSTEYYHKADIVFNIRQDPETLRCPECGSRNVIGRGQFPRTFRMVPIGFHQVVVTLPVQRVECRACGVIRQVKIAFADSRRSYTRAFERYVLGLLHYATIQDVARHLGVSWDVIKDIQKRHLKKRFALPALKGIRQLAIDEIYVGRKRFLTIVMDLQSGAVVFVGEGKGGEALQPFWKRLKRNRGQIEAVAIDLSPAYRKAVRRYLRKAVIVHDHFHVIKLVNEKLTRLRRRLYNETGGLKQKAVLKGTRWLLLKHPEHLDDSRDESKRLAEALALNQPLATAYYLKDELRLLWSQPNKAMAAVLLGDWIRRAQASGIRELKQLARTFSKHETGILAYYDYPISTGPLEATNNKIKTMQRQAYGYRDQEFFRLKICSLHETKYALVG
jgi:transposase